MMTAEKKVIIIIFHEMEENRYLIKTHYSLNSERKNTMHTVEISSARLESRGLIKKTHRVKSSMGLCVGTYRH